MTEAVHSSNIGRDFSGSRSEETSEPKWMPWAGWGVSGLIIAFLLFDSVSKLAFERHVVEATMKIGYPVEALRPLGVICLVCTILYAVPRTAVLGAIILTGYLGGAIASKVRHRGSALRLGAVRPLFRLARLGRALSPRRAAS
jgi:hypothetical protein